MSAHAPHARPLRRQPPASAAAAHLSDPGRRPARRSALPARGWLGAAPERHRPQRLEGLRRDRQERVVHGTRRSLRTIPWPNAAQRPPGAWRHDGQWHRTHRESVHRESVRRRRALSRVHAGEGIELRRLPAGTLRSADLRQLGRDRWHAYVGRRRDLSQVDQRNRRRRIGSARERVAASGRMAVVSDLVPRAALRRRRQEDRARALPARAVQRPGRAEGRRHRRTDPRPPDDSRGRAESADAAGRSRTGRVPQHVRPAACARCVTR